MKLRKMILWGLSTTVCILLCLAFAPKAFILSIASPGLLFREEFVIPEPLQNSFILIQHDNPNAKPISGLFTKRFVIPDSGYLSTSTAVSRAPHQVSYIIQKSNGQLELQDSAGFMSYLIQNQQPKGTFTVIVKKGQLINGPSPDEIIQLHQPDRIGVQ